MSFTTFIKRQANKSIFLKRAYGAARWKLHVLRDSWGALV